MNHLFLALALTLTLEGSLFAGIGCSSGHTMCLDGVSYETGNDNYSDCSAHVRERIAGLRKRYPRFHFSCENGFLKKLFVPANTDLAQKLPEQVAKEESDLFSAHPESIELRSGKFKDTFQHTVYQYYRGHEIWSAEAFRRSPVQIMGIRGVTEQDFTMFYVRLVDTSSWNFEPQERVDRHEAERKARELEGGDPDSYHSENWPVIVEHFCKGGPALVQRISVFGHTGERTTMHIIPVDVTTGRACAWK